MSNETNETIADIVADIRAEVGEYLTSIGPSELPSETQVEEFADRFVAAHEREIAAKNAEIEKLRALVNELADAIDSYPCHNCKHGSERCEWCGTVKELDALVA